MDVHNFIPLFKVDPTQVKPRVCAMSNHLRAAIDFGMGSAWPKVQHVPGFELLIQQPFPQKESIIKWICGSYLISIAPIVGWEGFLNDSGQCGSYLF